MDQPDGGSGPWKSSAWSFGSLVKSLTSKSEEVLQAYQRDLQEFGVGLKRETTSAAEVTAHAVKDLPISLETTAAVAQESLEAVGQKLEDFGSSVWRGTADLIGQVKEAVKKVDEEAIEESESSSTPTGTAKYNRYDAQLNALQCDSGTYCDEPDDQDDYSAWKSTFDLRSRDSEVELLIDSHPFIQEIYGRVVPKLVDNDTFWMRYFYRVHKLQQAEDARADLVKRASAVDEDLSWEVDEDNNGDDETTPRLPEDSAPASAKESIAEDEVRSDNSTSSEWLVVQEDSSSSDAPQSSTSEKKDTKSQDAVKSNKTGETPDEDWGEWE